jgi:hypothetical protein
MVSTSEDISYIAMNSVQDEDLTQMYSHTLVNNIFNKGISFEKFIII